MTIILPEKNEDEQAQEDNPLENLKYQATDNDEECFFLMYHMNFQPSEAYKLDPDHRKWIISRFVAQKHLERELMDRQRLASAIGPNLRVTE